MHLTVLAQGKERQESAYAACVYNIYNIDTRDRQVVRPRAYGYTAQHVFPGFLGVWSRVSFSVCSRLTSLRPAREYLTSFNTRRATVVSRAG